MFEIQKLKPKEYYIFCLCPVPNNEYLWEQYADMHKGVTIGFDVEFFAKLTFSEFSWARPGTLFPVNYDVEGFSKSVSNRFDNVKEPALYVIPPIKVRSDLHKAPHYIEARTIISECSAEATMLKNPQYSAENEWRFLHAPDMGQWELDKKKIGGKRRAIWSFNSPLPIRKIILGNNCIAPDNEIKKLLSNLGYNPDLIEHNKNYSPVN